MSVMIDHGPCEKIEWPSREEWAKQHRTFYADQGDEVRVSERLADYGTPEEIKGAIAEAKALWTEMGRQMKALGPAITDAEWHRRYFAASTREAKDALLDTPEFRRLAMRDDRAELNREIIKPLADGRIPERNFRVACGETTICSGKDCTDRLPKAAELVRRYWSAREAAYEAKKAEYAARPIMMKLGKRSFSAAPVWSVS